LVSGGTTDDRTGTINGGEVGLWDSQTGQSLWTVPLGLGSVTIAFSPDGTRLASGDANRTVTIWRVR
jgi:WD40 repeat protein